MRMTRPKQLETTYVFNKLNDQVTLISPDTGTTTYEFDDGGNRTAQVDANGVRTQYVYDELNRLTERNYPQEPGKDVAYYYDVYGATVATCPTTSYPKGRMTAFTDHSGETTLCYDHRGNVTAKLQKVSAKTLTTTWTYTLANRVSSITYESGKTITFERDTVGRINEVTVAGATVVGGGGANLITDVRYEPFGPVRQITYGDTKTQSRTYDQNYWVKQIDSSRSTGLDAFYAHDEVGNIVALSATTIPSGSGLQTDRAIDYDDLNRLTQVRDRNNALIEGFTYDATGNRLSKNVPNVIADSEGTYSYTGNKLTYVSREQKAVPINGETRSYDSAGNLVNKSYPEGFFGCCSQSYIYDDRNRLTEVYVPGAGVRTLELDYNGRGERVEVNEDYGKPTYFVYDESGRLLGEYNNDGVAISEVIWLDNFPVGTIRGTDVYPIESDQLGTPRIVANGDTAIWKWDLFGPVFGDGQADEDPDSDLQVFRFDLRFPGQQYDRISKLHYNYFRDYEAGTGRYIESDPIGLRGGLATFGYVSSRPLRWKDPDGLAPLNCNNAGGTSGQLQCDGNGNYEIVNCNRGCTRHCTQRHESVHLTDWKARFGSNSCAGFKKGDIPPKLSLGPWPSEHSEFVNESECRASQESIDCAIPLIDDEKCEGAGCQCVSPSCSSEAQKYKERHERFRRARSCVAWGV